MHWLIAAYSISFNRRHKKVGHLFQGRYKSLLVEEGDYLLGLSRYLHLNPVRGRVIGAGDPKERRQRLRSYRWSSYRGYAGLAKQDDFVSEELVLGEFGGVTALRRSAKAIEPRVLVSRVAARYGMSVNKLLRESVYGSEARNLAIWLAWHKSGLTLREIGVMFGGLDYAAVSQRVRRMQRRAETDKKLRGVFEILNV